MMSWQQAKIVYGGLAIAYQKENRYFFWDNIVYSIRTLIEPLILLIFWQAVAVANHTTDVSSVTIYFISSALIQRFTSSWIGDDLKSKIQTGELSRYLLTPGSAILNFLTFELNLKKRRLLVTIPLTMVLYALFLPHIQYTPHYLQLLALVVAIPCAYSIYFCLRMLIACLAFWFFQISGFEDISNAIGPFLDGSFIPPVFFPQGVATIVKLLPFRYSLSFPLELISFDIPTSEMWWSMGAMLFWTITLIASSYWVWHQGLRKYHG